MNYVDVAQRSEQWAEERMGSVGASEIFDAVAKQKSGKYYAKREDMLYKKLCERLGISSRGYVSKEMQHGIDNESNARIAYEFLRNVNVMEVGLFRHNRIPNTHASPDGVIDNVNVGVEIKCPSSVTHLKTLMTGDIPENYLFQMQWQMACAGYDAVEFVSYDPRFTPKAQLFVKRIQRDNDLIAEIEKELEIFMSDLDKLEAQFNAKYAEAA
jgi:hypothetical protein